MSRLSIVKYKWMMRVCKIVQIYLACLYIILLFLSFYLNRVNIFNKLFIITYIYQMINMFYCIYYTIFTDACLNEYSFKISNLEVSDKISGLCILLAFVIPFISIILNFYAFRDRWLLAKIAIFICINILAIDDIWMIKTFSDRYSDIANYLNNKESKNVK